MLNSHYLFELGDWQLSYAYLQSTSRDREHEFHEISTRAERRKCY